MQGIGAGGSVFGGHLQLPDGIVEQTALDVEARECKTCGGILGPAYQQLPMPLDPVLIL